MEVDFSFLARFQHVFLENEYKRSLSCYKSLNEKNLGFLKNCQAIAQQCALPRKFSTIRTTRECEIFKRQDLTIYSQPQHCHTIFKSLLDITKSMYQVYLLRQKCRGKRDSLASNGWFLVASLYQCLNLIQCDIYT